MSSFAPENEIFLGLVGTPKISIEFIPYNKGTGSLCVSVPKDIANR